MENVTHRNAADLGRQSSECEAKSGQMAELWVEVDQLAQVLRVVSGDSVVRAMLISSGKDETPTPNGSFRIQNRGEWFFNGRYGQGAKYWVSFDGWGKYLIHSVTCDRNKEVIKEEAELLGAKASHGCIRMSVEDARWFYESIPQGTRVEIHA